VTQIGVDRIERPACIGDGTRRFGFARPHVVGFIRQRIELRVEFIDARSQAFALRLDAIAIRDAGVRLRIEADLAAATARRDALDARGDFARPLRFNAAFLALQFERVELRAQRLRFGAERCGARRGRGLHAFVARGFGSHAFALFAARRARAQVRENFEIAHACGNAPVTLRAPDLVVELGHAPLEFGDQIVDANRVLLGRIEPAHRLGFAREKLADARGLFEQGPAFGRLRGQDRIDLALRDDRIRARSEARAHQHLDHVAQAHRRAVDEEFRFAGAIGAARDLDFFEVDRQLAVAVVERQRDFGHAERLARAVAREDDVFHLLRAQRTRALFAQHPTDRIDEIRLPRAVGPDDGGDPGGEIEGRRFGERFEAENFERFESHRWLGCLRFVAGWAKRDHASIGG
jgi:hypothetical protein